MGSSRPEKSVSIACMQNATLSRADESLVSLWAGKPRDSCASETDEATIRPCRKYETDRQTSYGGETDRQTSCAGKTDETDDAR